MVYLVTAKHLKKFRILFFSYLLGIASQFVQSERKRQIGEYKGTIDVKVFAVKKAKEARLNTVNFEQTITQKQKSILFFLAP